MADNDPVPESDALEQADVESELIDIDDTREIGVEVAEADAIEQGRSRAVPAAVAARPIPFDAPEHDVLEQRLPAGDEDDDDDFR
jgi:hypothetical protein